MAARLFEDLPEPRLLREALGPGTAILNGFAHGVEASEHLPARQAPMEEELRDIMNDVYNKYPLQRCK